MRLWNKGVIHVQVIDNVINKLPHLIQMVMCYDNKLTLVSMTSSFEPHLSRLQSLRRLLCNVLNYNIINFKSTKHKSWLNAKLVLTCLCSIHSRGLETSVYGAR